MTNLNLESEDPHSSIIQSNQGSSISSPLILVLDNSVFMGYCRVIVHILGFYPTDVTSSPPPFVTKLPTSNVFFFPWETKQPSAENHRVQQFVSDSPIYWQSSTLASQQNKLKIPMSISISVWFLSNPCGEQDWYFCEAHQEVFSEAKTDKSCTDVEL